jgi:hypothetical protein
MLHPRGSESNRKVFEFVMIQGKNDKGEIGEGFPREGIEVPIRECFGELNLALAPAAAKNDCIAILDPSDGCATAILQ